MLNSAAPPRRSLENEVIIAVVVLYVLIATVMIIVHYAQPVDTPAATSSTSPSHSERSTTKPADR